MIGSLSVLPICSTLFMPILDIQNEQTNPARLLVKRFEPGKCRIEPGFSIAKDALPAQLKADYLARGQAEMQAFTHYLKRCWQTSRSREQR